MTPPAEGTSAAAADPPGKPAPAAPRFPPGARVRVRDDWPERMDRGEWQDGYAVLSPHDLRHGRYHGPVAMPPRLAAAFHMRLLKGAV